MISPEDIKAYEIVYEVKNLNPNLTQDAVHAMLKLRRLKYQVDQKGRKFTVTRKNEMLTFYGEKDFISFANDQPSS